MANRREKRKRFDTSVTDYYNLIILHIKKQNEYKMFSDSQFLY